ncbi:MAG: DUF4139 domain-containing protein [Micromonosporaceae bacterium]
MTDDALTSAGAAELISELVLDAPITAVTVYPDRARVSRRGRLPLAAGEHRVILEPLPLTLLPDSVRVAGIGAATVLGVDVVRRHQPRTTDETARQLEEELRQARAGLAALEDEDAVAEERLAFYSGLARRSTRAYASALAAGASDPGRVAELADALAAQQAAVRETRRALAERRERVQEQIKAYERGLEARRRQREPDHIAAVIGLLADADSISDVELEVSYVVEGAGWHSIYDVRLNEDALTLSWFGLVNQRTGEDWPECDLRLSTARPSGTMAVPELDPWFLDRVRPMPPPEPLSFAMRRGAAAVGAAQAFADEEASGVVADLMATVEQGTTAATYQPARPVAVPADGSAHRVSLAVVELPAALDYVTAPVRAAEAHLRATVTNTSAHTLPAGTAAVFQGGDFVGNSALATWAPGEEVELALGIDDRIRIERELVRRTAGKAVLGSTRRREAEHRITITNRTPRTARVRVLDQLPVSRDEAIVVKELRVEPAPAERTEMGVLTWELTLSPGEEKRIHLGVRVELGRGVELAGWRE